MQRRNEIISTEVPTSFQDGSAAVISTGVPMFFRDAAEKSGRARQ